MKIEVWSDFVCPFCYIGKRRMEKGLEKFTHDKNITIEYKSYQLAPNVEVDPTRSYYENLSDKYGMSMDEAKASIADMSKQAAELGLTYNFDAMKPSNTYDAHRLAKYAAKEGKGNELTERLLKAHFTESENLGDHAVLIKLAGEVGLETEAVAVMLQTDGCGVDVQADQEHAQEIGVQGVPFFVFNEKYALSGAQPGEAFLEVLEKLLEEENEQPVLQTLNSKRSETTYCCEDDCDK